MNATENHNDYSLLEGQCMTVEELDERYEYLEKRRKWYNNWLKNRNKAESKKENRA